MGLLLTEALRDSQRGTWSALHVLALCAHIIPSAARRGRDMAVDSASPHAAKTFSVSHLDLNPEEGP